MTYLTSRFHCSPNPKVGAAGFENTPLGSGPWKFVKREIADWQPSNGSTTALAFETLKPTPTK